MQSDSTTYRTISGFPNYRVSDDGNVWSTRMGHIMSPEVTWQGYRRVDLKSGGNHKRIKVGKLVLLAFVGPPPTPQHVPDHINGIKGDDRLSNLEWVTKAVNHQRAVDMGLIHTNKGGLKLNLTKARDIREKALTRTHRDIAREYGVTNTLIGMVVNGKVWKERAAPLLAEQPDP